MNQDPQLETEKRLSSISYAVHTDTGRRREENQDSYGVIEGHSLKVFMVADGMGGARGGAVASSLAIDLLKSALRGQENLSCEDIVSTILQVNKAIAEKGALESSLSGMGTTLVGIAFVADKTFVFNVGDSRLYRMRKNGFDVCTEDHTLVQELLKSGAIGPEQARNHPVSHMLTRSLGPSTELKVDCIELENGPFASERFLICSDGLYNQANISELESYLRQFSKEDAVVKLIDLANSRGGPDNITAIIVELGSEFPEDPSTDVQLEKQIDSNTPQELNNELGASAAKENASSEATESGDRIVVESSEVSSPTFSKSSRLFSGLPMLLLVSFLSAFAILLVGLLDSNPVVQSVPLPAAEVSSATIIPTQAPSPTSINVEIKTPIATQTSIPSIIKADNIIISGEQALSERQEVLKLKLIELNNKAEFISQSEDLRKKQLQELNDDKLKIISRSSEIQKQQEISNKRVTDLKKMLEQVEGGDLLALAKQLADKSPIVAAANRDFQQATYQYLQALQEKKTSSDAQAASQNADLKLRSRTDGFNRLKQSIIDRIKEESSQLDSQLSKFDFESKDLQVRLLENDNKRVNFSEILAISDPQLQQDAKLKIQKEISAIESEIAVLKP